MVLPIPPLTPEVVGKFISQVGAPTVIALLIIWQLAPRIDYGIQIAERVDADLSILAARGCVPAVVVPVQP